MDVTAFIQSGLLETYILGFSSEQESLNVENMAAQYPEVKLALESTRESLRSYITGNSLPPSPGLKHNIMKRVYRDEALLDKRYVPLLNEAVEWASIQDSIHANRVNDFMPVQGEMFAHALPSTPSITNIAVWIRTALEEDAHSDFNEYIAVVDGSCVMFLGDSQKKYGQGEIIFIPPHIPHKALVTSPGGMLALVQRQAF